MREALLDDKHAVSGEFDRVAGTYDRLTSKNPGYLRHLRMSAARLGLGPGARVLDLCCGTGLSTGALLDVYPDARVIGLDASDGMLAVARRKHFDGDVRFVRGDAMDPGAADGVDGPFVGILMAYGIRNVPFPDACLVRLLDLLAPGGAICFHEYSVADSLRSRMLWNAVSFGLIIPGGLATAGTARIYRYLRRSVNAFDGVRAFEDRLAGAGFEAIRTHGMDGWQRGILHSFVARRPS